MTDIELTTPRGEVYFRAPTRALPSPEKDRVVSKELIKAIAKEIGAGTVAYIEVMYPEAIKATSSTFKLSIRNHIHNAIVAIAELHDEVAIRHDLNAQSSFRKHWVQMYRNLRRRSKMQQAKQK